MSGWDDVEFERQYIPLEDDFRRGIDVQVCGDCGALVNPDLRYMEKHRRFHQRIVEENYQ